MRLFCVGHLKGLLSNIGGSVETFQWPKLPNHTHYFLKALLIQVLEQEEDSPTRKVLCELIGELGSTIRRLSPAIKAQMGEEGQQWDNLIQNIWNFFTSGNTIYMECGLKVLSILFQHSGNPFPEHNDELCSILNQALEHEDIRVKSQAIEAISSFVGTVQANDCLAFEKLIPLVLDSTVIIIIKDKDLVRDHMLVHSLFTLK